MKGMQGMRTLLRRGLLALAPLLVIASALSAGAQNRHLRNWGYNGYGQLGDGTTLTSNIPVKAFNISMIIQLVGGEKHTLAIMQDATVWAWGSNSDGQLGDGTNNDSSVPVQVKDPSDPTGYLTNVTGIAAGANHSLAIKLDGTLRAWGRNSNGQLGDGTTTNRKYPVQAIDPAHPTKFLQNVRQIAGGASHSVAMRANKRLWTWGNNDYGQLGDGTHNERHIPTQLAGVSEVASLSARSVFTVISRLDGTVWAWGRNDQGQLGNGTVTDSASPVQAVGVGGATQVAAGESHTLAVKADGTVWAWGRNAFGQLGDGTTTERHVAVQVKDAGDPSGFLQGVWQATAGNDHSAAVKTTRKVWTWGSNANGELGNGTDSDSWTALHVPNLNNVVWLNGGAQHVLTICRPPRIDVTPAAGVYGQNIRLEARLRGRPDGDALQGKTLVFEIDGATIGSATTDAKGFARYIYKVSEGLKLGEHKLSALFAPDNDYLESDGASVLVVGAANTKLSSVNAAAKVGGKALLRVRLQRASDNASLAGLNVKFDIDGNYVGQATTDAKGYAELSYKVPEIAIGQHAATARFDKTDQYAKSSSTGTLAVSKADSSLAAGSASQSKGKSVSLKATLKRTSDGSRLAGRTVSFKVNGDVVGTGTTDANGVAEYLYAIPAATASGAYPIAALFDGDDYDNASAGSATLTVK